jgi:hypothetical protein
MGEDTAIDQRQQKRLVVSTFSWSMVLTIPHWPLPAVCDLTRDGRWSTYDESVLKLSNVTFRGKCARMGKL